MSFYIDEQWCFSMSLLLVFGVLRKHDNGLKMELLVRWQSATNLMLLHAKLIAL